MGYSELALSSSQQQAPFWWRPVCRMEPKFGYRKKILETHQLFQDTMPGKDSLEEN